jgi:hypothetical protein
MSKTITDPFCDKGCRDVYVHVSQCMNSSYLPTDPALYYSLYNEELIEEYASLYADYHRYGTPGEFHKPTIEEAGRRLGLVKDEILRRMEIK